MRVVSLIFGVLAALGLLLGLLPLFGWLNWIFVLPPAVLGLIFGAMSRDRGAINDPQRCGGGAGCAAADADAGRRRILDLSSINAEHLPFLGGYWATIDG